MGHNNSTIQDPDGSKCLGKVRLNKYLYLNPILKTLLFFLFCKNLQEN